jgi:hypothetical protein
MGRQAGYDPHEDSYREILAASTGVIRSRAMPTEKPSGG